MLRRRRWVAPLAAAAAILVVVAGAIALLQRPSATPERTPIATVRPTPTPVPGPTLRAGLAINLLAVNIEFKPKLLEVPAGAAFVIHLRNLESGEIAHVVDLRLPDGTTVGEEQEPIFGGQEADYAYGPLPAGDYVLICRVHPIPAMTGTLRVR